MWHLRRAPLRRSRAGPRRVAGHDGRDGAPGSRFRRHPCAEYDIRCARDVFRDYRCDAASAIEAGNDIRTALVCFAADASHGYERTHLRSLEALAQLLALYMQSPPTFRRDRKELGPLEGFPMQNVEFQRFVEEPDG